MGADHKEQWMAVIYVGAIVLALAALWQLGRMVLNAHRGRGMRATLAV